MKSGDEKKKNEQEKKKVIRVKPQTSALLIIQPSRWVGRVLLFPSQGKSSRPGWSDCWAEYDAVVSWGTVRYKNSHGAQFLYDE